MSTDRETLAAYAARIDDYRNMASESAQRNEFRDAFIAALPTDARVLDLGCGPGHDAAAMADAGLDVIAMDASPEMIAVASAIAGLTTRLASFADLSDVAAFDGVWASFSLLHAPRAEFPAHLGNIFRALKPGGLFMIGMKTGIGEARDALGRYYTYYEVKELTDLLQAAGFNVTTSKEGRAKGLAGPSEPFVVMTAHA